MSTPWLAATLQASPSRHDTLLVEHLPSLLETLPDGVDRWFFERGPDALELRFRGSSQPLRLHVLLWGMDVLDAGTARRMTLDDRSDFGADFAGYGGPATAEAALDFYHADSNAVLTQLRLAHAGMLTISRERLEVLGMAELTRTWYGSTSAVSGPSRQLALLAPWWQKRAEALRVYSRLVAWLDPSLAPAVLRRLLRLHQARLLSLDEVLVGST